MKLKQLKDYYNTKTVEFVIKENYELVEDCETTAKTLTVTFNQNLTTEAPNLTYHRLIPKLMIGEELNVELIVN